MQIASITFGSPLPLLSRAVSASFPSPADDFAEEEIDLTRLLVANRAATFLVRVAGDSMVGKGLFDGDLAVVDRSLVPRDGDVVVVDVDGERSFKVWSRGAGVVRGSFSPPMRKSRSGASSRAASIHVAAPTADDVQGRTAAVVRASSTVTPSTARASASSTRGFAGYR